MIHRATILSNIGIWALLAGGAVTAHAVPQPPDAAENDLATSDDDVIGESAANDTPAVTGTADGEGTDTGASNAAADAAAPVSAQPAVPPLACCGSTAIDASVTIPAPPTTDHADHTLIEEDVQPTVVIYHSDNVQMRLGGLVQVHVAPYVGSGSQVGNDDLATNEGLRLRRARLGIEGSFGGNMSLLLVVNPLESDPEVGTLSSARLTFRPLENLRVNVGTDSVPFTRAELESSKSLASIERPLVARTIVPTNRLGVTVEGMVTDRLAYVVGVLNGTPGYEQGNRFGGFMYAARLQINAIGHPSAKRPEDLGLAVSLGGLFEDGSAVRREGASADIYLTVARASAKVEMVCDRSRPQDAPMPAPSLADTVERCGGYVELGYTFPKAELQPIVRAEYFDDDRNVDDAGDSLLFSVGVNARLHPYSRVQLHYLSRRERNGDQLPNDAVVMNLQGEF